MYDKVGRIRVVEEEAPVKKIYRRLNQPAPYHSKLNAVIFIASTVLGVAGVLLYSLGVDTGFLPAVLEGDWQTMAVFVLAVLLYFLPTMLVSSCWKDWTLLENQCMV